MATYKVIQDIEAEDKFLGPLTLKQFIFAAGGIVSTYLGFFSVIKNVPFLLLFFGPIALLGFFLAIPWSRDQPTEVWVLAKLRFKLKPRKRIWSQDGIQELVTITAPKKIEQFLTDNLSQTEVKSRLKILADTIDSRGWAVKNTAIGVPISPGQQNSQRLINLSSLQMQVPDLASNDLADPLDVEDSPVAAKFDHMIQNSQQNMREGALNVMESARTAPPKAPSAPATQSLSPTADDKLISEQLKLSNVKRSAAVGSLHTIPTKPADKVPQEKKAQASMPATPSTGILNLSQNNDLDVATIARQAKREEPPEEVVISLH